MKILFLIGQRIESYLGEYAPEVLESIDEIGNDDNPDFMKEALVKAKDSGEFENVIIVTVDVDGANIMKMLRPQAQVIAGTIV